MNNIGGGIVYSILMIILYARTGNILLPSFIHSFLDALKLI